MITDKPSLTHWVDEARYMDPAWPTELEPEGMTVLSAHWQSCFYFWGGHTKAKRAALAQCMARYIDLFDDKLTWGFKTQPNGRWRATWRDHTKSFEQVLQENPDAIEYYLASGNPKWEDYASPFIVSCMTKYNWEKREGSNLCIRVPHQYVLDDSYRPLIDELINQCLKLLSPYYAISGLQSATPYNQNSVAPDVYQQAQHNLGIMQGDIYSDGRKMQHGIKSLDWLTYISHELAHGYGTAEQFYQQAKRQQIDITPLDNGYLIKASELPQVLPVIEPIPDDYIKINDLLRPLRNGAYGMLSIGGWEDEPPRFDLMSSDAWIRRFDAPNIFPVTKLSPVEVKTKRRHSIASGNICQHSGRYRYNEDTDSDGKPLYHEYDNLTDYQVGFDVGDFRQFVVLNKGDIVPYYLDIAATGGVRRVKAIEWTLVSEFVKVDNTK